VFRQAYVTYIRSLLEYASNVWSHHLLMHINSIERVQRHLTKRITELLNCSYRERLSILNLDTLLFEWRFNFNLKNFKIHEIVAV